MAISNKVKFGLKNVHYALITASSNGTVTYATPKRIPGAVNLSLDAQGETNTFYADDTAYYVSTSNDGYSGNLEMAQIPDDFRKDVLSETEDATSKVLIENADVDEKPFALLFEIDGNVKPTRHVLYNCVASRPGVGGKTKEKSKTPETETVSITASPDGSGRVKAKTTADTPAATYDKWFSSVWKPGA